MGLKVSQLRVAESGLTCNTWMQNYGGSVREDEAQRNGEPNISPFSLDMPEIVPSQLASEILYIPEEQ